MHNSGQGSHESRPQFKLVMRGYAPREVDDFLALLSDDPDLPLPRFARVMRGYDPAHVDLYIESVKADSHPPRP